MRLEVLPKRRFVLICCKRKFVLSTENVRHECVGPKSSSKVAMCVERCWFGEMAIPGNKSIIPWRYSSMFLVKRRMRWSVIFLIIATFVAVARCIKFIKSLCSLVSVGNWPQRRIIVITRWTVPIVRHWSALSVPCFPSPMRLGAGDSQLGNVHLFMSFHTSGNLVFPSTADLSGLFLFFLFVFVCAPPFLMRFPFSSAIPCCFL